MVVFGDQPAPSRDLLRIGKMRKVESIEHDFEPCVGKRQVLRVAFQEFDIGLGFPGTVESSG
jgi:hypothetical protein